MTFKQLFSLALFTIFITTACNNSSSEYAPKAEFNTMADSVSYAIGFQNGSQIALQGFSDIDVENFFAGFKTGIGKEDSELGDANLQGLFNRFRTFLNDKIKLENLEEGKAFLAENRTKEGVIETPSGLQYKIIEEGTGKSPTSENKVSVRYEGTLIDGTVFDSNFDAAEPNEFVLGAVIPGWIEGVALMKEGATYEFYIPAELGYGENPRPGGAIQPNDLLIFTIELIEVK